MRDVSTADAGTVPSLRGEGTLTLTPMRKLIDPASLTRKKGAKKGF